ncbi:MAG: hypothetical protein AAGH88_09075 [Planctomycetota bacterium]
MNNQGRGSLVFRHGDHSYVPDDFDRRYSLDNAQELLHRADQATREWNTRSAPVAPGRLHQTMERMTTGMRRVPDTQTRRCPHPDEAEARAAEALTRSAEDALRFLLGLQNRLGLFRDAVIAQAEWADDQQQRVEHTTARLNRDEAKNATRGASVRLKSMALRHRAMARALSYRLDKVRQSIQAARQQVKEVPQVSATRTSNNILDGGH